MAVRARTIFAFVLLFSVAFILARMSLIYWAFVVLSIVFLFVGAVMLAGYLKFSREKKKELKSLPSVSILIPCYNRAHTIEKCVNSVKAMRYPEPFEIIVVDDASKDNSYNMLKKMCGIKLFRNEKNRGKAASLNRAMKIAKGDVVACIDADTYPTPEALERMAACFYNEKVGAVSALIKPSETKNLLQKAQEIEYLIGFGFSQSAMSSLNSIIVTPGPMALYQRQLLIDLGGYDEHNLTEDMEIALRIRKNHYDIVACPAAKVYTETPNGWKAWLRQRQRWYRGKIFNTYKYKEMLFNLKYGEVAHFGLPLTFLLEMSSVFMLFLILSSLVDGLLFGAGVLAAYIHTGFFSFGIAPIIINSASVFVNAVILANFTVAVVLSHQVAREKIGLGKLPGIVFIVIGYSLLVSIVWLVSLFKEINKSSSQW